MEKKKKGLLERQLQWWRITHFIVFDWVGIISVGVSIVSIYVSISRSDSDYKNVVYALLLMLFGIMLLFVNNIRHYDKARQNYNNLEHKLAYLIDKQAKLLRQREVTAKGVHNICHEFRSETSLLFLRRLSNNPHDTQIGDFYTLMMANIKEIFDVITDDSCSVCIKIVERGNKISTLVRDPFSRRAREPVDSDAGLDSFDFRQNTAFLKILDDNDPATYYASDDLKALAKKREYRNFNPNWELHYNATLVAPIRYNYNKKHKKETSVLGFICVDNFRGKLDNETAKDLLAWVADLCFLLWLMIGQSDYLVEGFKNFVAETANPTTPEAPAEAGAV